jgi:His/Glu/Gln/Arg/opine family amino acid ABC transporter permease subunit
MALLQMIGFSPTGWGGLLLVAALMTLCVTAVALLIGAILGSLVAWAKLSGSRIMRTIGGIYTTVFRGVPELLIIYLVYFGGSSAVTAIGTAMGYEGFLGLPSFAAGALAVGVISGAYQAEVFRGAYLAIPKGELEAAQAIGMNRSLRPAGVSLCHSRHRQCLAAQPQGLRSCFGDRPCRPDAHQPGRSRIDAAALPVLHCRRLPLSGHDEFL